MVKHTTTKAAKKKTGKDALKKPPGPTFFDKGDVDDHISRLLDAQRLVPEEFRGTDKFLDIVSWNIRWFDHRDPRRIAAILDVMETINADVFVLTEIAADGALDEVVKGLAERDAGYYSTAYGTTGEEQRVVLMWDRDWIRMKHKPMELFPEREKVKAEDGRKLEVFPRLPLWGYFEALSDKPGQEGFSFELVGVHLKSQMPPRGFKPEDRFGIKQRARAAEQLAKWMTTPEEHFDQDILVVGDWNAEPDKAEWKALRDLEQSGEIDFMDINPAEEITHIARLNKSGPAGTRLDLHLITNSAEAENLSVEGEQGVVIQWSLFKHLNLLSSADRTALYKAMRTNFSDHLPCVSRFYFAA